MIEKLLNYMKLKNIEAKDSPEETVNLILEALQNDEDNVFTKKNILRDELISSSALVLNGLRKIKDPVKLYKNLGLAFERRKICIFTNTVVSAFNRLGLEAAKIDKSEEIFKIWRKFKNQNTKFNSLKYLPIKKLHILKASENSKDMKIAIAEALGNRLPIEQLRLLLKDRNDPIKYGAAVGIASNRGLTLEELYKLSENQDEIIVKGISEGIKNRSDLTNEFLEKWLEHKNPVLKENVAYLLILRKSYPKESKQKLLKSKDFDIFRGAYNASIEERYEHPLKYIRGNKTHRTLTIKKLMKPLRR